MPKKKSKNKKTKKKRGSAILLTIVIILVVVLAAGAVLAFLEFRSYSGYSITESTELSSSSGTAELFEYGDGYILCSTDGVTYFSKSGVIWADSLELSDPITDTCGDYIAVCDSEGSEVYIYNSEGFISSVSTNYALLDVEISDAGVVAMATNSSSSNYIELKDRDGNDLVTAKSVFSSSGYLVDIALSDDGTKLAAAFVYTADGALESKVLFYDFSDSSDSDDVLVGGFNQYTNTLLTNVIFLSETTVCAVGDNALTFYDFSETPEIISESLELEWQLQSLYVQNDRLLLIALDETGSNSYTGYVYDSSGTAIAAVSLDSVLDCAVLAGRNIVLYSSSEFFMYSFNGQKRISASFDESVSALICAGSRSRLLYISSGTAEFIRLG